MPIIEQQEMVSQHVLELGKIVDVRKKMEKDLEEAQLKMSYTSDSIEVEKLTNRVMALEKEINKLNVLGRGIIQKIEKLNGVK
jgi:hypothetical protein